nr:MAG TPA: hypothetical protein [Crassvirales sp.]
MENMFFRKLNTYEIEFFQKAPLIGILKIDLHLEIILGTYRLLLKIFLHSILI